MNNQEQKIIKLLLNEMAFEGARKHFREASPEISEQLLQEIEHIGIPEKYDGKTESYQYAQPRTPSECPVYDRCYEYLRLIRNNIVHANKAYRPDTPERLTDLLTWAEQFIEAVYETESYFSKRAKEIKLIMRIESF